MFSKVHEISLNGMRKSELSFEEVHFIGLTFNEEKDADNMMALFPKYMKIFRTEVSDGKCCKPYVVIDISTRTDKVTGDRNEAGEKRRNKFLQVIKANNVSIEDIINR